jgi:hypothetical protein
MASRLRDGGLPLKPDNDGVTFDWKGKEFPIPDCCCCDAGRGFIYNAGLEVQEKATDFFMGSMHDLNFEFRSICIKIGDRDD